MASAESPTKLGGRGACALGACCCFVIVCAAACSGPKSAAVGGWDQKAAAAYLDERAGLWSSWPSAARDHGTFCISCHTALTYSLSRPALRGALGEQAPSEQETKLIDNVTTRVRMWPQTEPYYKNMPEQSRGTEAVLNALILASHDGASGHLSDDTRTAFHYMWATQQSEGANKGAWLWILFNNEPWEAADSPYYGATLAAAAVGVVPENYRAAPEIQSNITMLRDYLVGNAAAQTPFNRVNLLWASEKLPGLLDAQQQQSIIAEILGAQRADGGWCLASLVGPWKRKDRTPLVTKSDGYATGYLTYVLEGAGLSRDDAHVARGLEWLMRNQSGWSGDWAGYSLNKRHYVPFFNGARFMDDAATAYAVLALTGRGRGAGRGQT